MVAASLRTEILSGHLTEGDTLPRQEDLLAEFNVSPPAVREALRILETEGLISVRRGNIGGAVVHVPTAEGVSYMVSLVLQVQKTSLEDVGIALRQLEPPCASLCALRRDRAKKVVPGLKALLQAQRDAPDLATFNQASRGFHEAIVASCGNDTMILVVGALERVWSAHEHTIYELSSEAGDGLRRPALHAHERLTAAIATGDADAAAAIARKHFDATNEFIKSTGAHDYVVADFVRGGPMQRHNRPGEAVAYRDGRR
jgi:GntR family transcriptional repressor for pyruvate dehydrogenase complex